MFYDTPILRMLFKGSWVVELDQGKQEFSDTAVFCGPNSKCLPVHVDGDFVTLSVALKPGAMGALGPFPMGPAMDRIIDYSAFGFDRDNLFARFEGLVGNSEAMMLMVEEIMREYLEHKSGKEPDALTRAFDMAALADPNIKVSEFAEQHEVSAKKVERIVKRDFGLSPKKVLRRARALDMAAILRGVGDYDEGDEMLLRYFDQSHLNREFVEFFGMSPMQFVQTPLPLLTLALETRQSRRLEALGRLEGGEKRPWES
ncbi:helix-turn-helix domain-containing protein [Altererythrobacter sp. MF3-039]|uniref:helix-turn-helix domain-containing protein n=1 Tax=Altererythrobacter sp. MF3-039 TaxID=3252901 RepID=UPI00390CA2F5